MTASQNSNDHSTTFDRKKNTGRIILLVLVLLCAVLVIFFYSQKKTEKAEDRTLSVAFYPIVPDLERFEEIVTENWEKVHPGVQLEFVDWSCYSEDPPEDLDVFVFDSIFLTDFIEQGYLLPIPKEAIHDQEDILSFAMEGCEADGNLYAVPQLLCAPILYTRKSDTELADVTDIVTLYEKIGDRKLQTEIPEENEGLLIDMSGGTTKVVMYLDAQIDENNTYTEYSDLPESEDLDEEAVDALRLLRKMGGEAQVNYEPEDGEMFVRARWFSEGKGRAMIAYTEAMSSMADYVDEVDFRTYSYSDKGDIPLFTSDLASVNAKIDDDKKELAFDLVDLLTSKDTMVAVSLPEDGQGAPQYLLPARISAFDSLGEQYPAYKRLEEITTNPDNRLFKIGGNARAYIKNEKKELPGLIFTQE